MTILKGPVEIYADGNARPGPIGVAGWGAYIRDADGLEVHGFGGAGNPATNNQAELKAITEIVRYLGTVTVDGVVTIHFDSQYVKEIFDRLDKYAAGGYRRADGALLKNQEQWQTLKGLLDSLPLPDIKTMWVKGHSGIHGNEEADKLAARGIACEKNGLGDTVTWNTTIVGEVVAGEGEPAPTIEYSPIHPMISGNEWGFLTNSPVTHNERYVYCSVTFPTPKSKKAGMKRSEKEKAADRIKLAGKPSADVHYGILFAKEPFPLFEEFRKRINATVPGHTTPAYVFLTVIRNKAHWPGVNADLDMYATFKDNYMVAPSSEVLALIPEAMRRSYFAMAEIDVGLQMYDWYMGENADVSKIDITDSFLEKDEKGNMKIRKDFTIGLSTITLNGIEYDYHGETAKVNIILTLGIDMPRRGTFSGLLKEKGCPEIKITLLIWEKTSHSFRCGVAVECGEYVGVYYTTHANLRFAIRKGK